MARSVLDQPHFKDEAAAFAYVEAHLWQRGPVCPHCGATDDHVRKLNGKTTYWSTAGLTSTRGRPRVPCAWSSETVTRNSCCLHRRPTTLMKPLKNKPSAPIKHPVLDGC